MKNEIELTLLRDQRECHQAISQIEKDAQHVAKRYKRGIKMIEGHIDCLEQDLETLKDGDLIAGASAFDAISPETKALITNPTLNNIPEDTNP